MTNEERYNGVQVASPASVQEAIAKMEVDGSAIERVEQQRAITEVQSALTVARACPRDQIKAIARIRANCQRVGFAEKAEFAYRRGSSMVEGPTIKLAEMLASSWGNIEYGFREIARTGNQESEVEAYCWDLETNTRARRVFTVEHVRDKGEGVVVLTTQRDRYEMVANMAQRRVRAVILQVIPDDLVELARDECRKTLRKGDGTPLADRISRALDRFEELGVSRAMVEACLQHPATAIVEAELPRLQQIYNSIKTGVARVDEVFPTKVIGYDPTRNQDPAKTDKTAKKRGKAQQAPRQQQEGQQEAAMPAGAEQSASEPLSDAQEAPGDELPLPGQATLPGVAGDGLTPDEQRALAAARERAATRRQDGQP